MRLDEMLRDSGGERRRVTVKTTSIDDAKAVRAKLAEHEASDGWVCFASGWKWRREGKERSSAQPAKGLPICAEFALGPDRSARLAYDGARWTWTEVDEAPAAEGEADWVFEQSLVANVEGAARMRYRVAWGKAEEASDGIRPFRPRVARFVGWEVE